MTIAQIVQGMHQTLNVAGAAGVSIRRNLAGSVYDTARRMLRVRLVYTRRILESRGVPRHLVQNVSSRDRDVRLLRGVLRRCRAVLV